MTAASDRPARGRLAAMLAAVAVAGGSGAVVAISPLGGGLAASLAARPVGQGFLTLARIATPEKGFRLHVDPSGRFSVPVPEDWDVRREDTSVWLFFTADEEDRATRLHVMGQDISGPVTLDELDAARDQELERSWEAQYLKTSSEPGTLDGLPALNRSFRVGDYVGWEVVVMATGPDGKGWAACLSFVSHDASFPSREITFRKVLGGFRSNYRPT